MNKIISARELARYKRYNTKLKIQEKQNEVIMAILLGLISAINGKTKTLMFRLNLEKQFPDIIDNDFLETSYDYACGDITAEQFSKYMRRRIAEYIAKGGK